MGLEGAEPWRSRENPLILKGHLAGQQSLQPRRAFHGGACWPHGARRAHGMFMIKHFPPTPNPIFLFLLYKMTF